MKNVYDIRYEKNLIYILPEETGHPEDEGRKGIYRKTAVILYLYYPDTLEKYYGYMDGIPDGIDLYIISSRQDVIDIISEHMERIKKRGVHYILKDNVGRDVSALLVTGREIVKKYEYVCFLHDKKAHMPELEKETEQWIENLWGNLLGCGSVNLILDMLKKQKRLGILAPPEPFGDHFCTWTGSGWGGSFSITKQIADRLGLHTDLTEKKPPITLGTALWFKSRALAKLFDAGFSLDRFDDEKLGNSEYLSYGLERIFAYVAQDAGYETGTVMTRFCAERQIGCFQYSAARLFGEAGEFFPIFNVAELRQYEESVPRILNFAGRNQKLYLYGAGERGKLCFYLLRNANFSPLGYVVSRKDGNAVKTGLPVYELSEVPDLENSGFIITVFRKEARIEIANTLKKHGIMNYIEFWDGAD